MKQTLFLWAVLLSAAILPVQAARTPFASADQPHAVIHLNGNPAGRRMAPVYLWTVDGTRVLMKRTPVFYLKPGTYRLTFRQHGRLHRGHVPGGPKEGSEWRHTRDTLTLSAKPGKVYYIAARPEGNGAWKAVVWRTGGEER